MRKRFVGRRRWAVLGAGILVLVATTAVTGVVTPSGSAYSFSDEFDGVAGAAPDPHTWVFDIGGGGWGNDERQIYTDSRRNSFLDGAGHLVLRATTDTENGIEVHRSARLKTLGTFSQRLGHWEARIQIRSARGFWPAWWMMGDDIGAVGWPACGEIDMVEDFGHSAVDSSVHTLDTAGRLRSSSTTTPNDDDFHVFRLDWTEEGVTFSRDGRPYGRTTWHEEGAAGLPRQPGGPMFMLLNLAVGGNAGDPPPDSPSTVEMLVDYVRVWT